jgi:hypothetical protein
MELITPVKKFYSTLPIVFVLPSKMKKFGLLRWPTVPGQGTLTERESIVQMTPSTGEHCTIKPVACFVTKVNNIINLK